MQQYAITAENLSKRYDDFLAVDQISFAIPKGSCFGFLGPNGAGKTSTMRMIGCVTPVSAGTLEVFELPTSEKNSRSIKERLGVVPQEDYLEQYISCYENLELYGRYFGIKGNDIQSKIKELLEFVHLEAKTHTQVRFLSGGMKRRLMIARALINHPARWYINRHYNRIVPYQIRIHLINYITISTILAIFMFIITYTKNSIKNNLNIIFLI